MEARVSTSWRVISSIIAITLLFALSVSSPDIARAGTIPNSGPAPVVNNPSQPVEPPRLFARRELWRAGGEDDVAGEPLGFVTDVDLDTDGNTYLLDNSMSRVQVFSPDGQWLRSLGREGDGPGEFRRAERFALLPGGDIGALQPMSAKLVGIAPDGTPAPDVALRGSEGIKLIGQFDAAKDRVIADLTETIRLADETHVQETLATYDRQGKPLSEILERTVKQSDQGRATDPDGNGSFGDCWAAGDDGRVFVARRPHEYRIEVFDLDGRPLQIIQRKYDPVKLSDGKLAEERERIDRLQRMTQGSGIHFELDPYERDITALYPRPNGELWVSTSRGALEQADGTIGVFDVFDAAGRYIRQVSLPADFSPERDDFELIRDRLYVLKEGQMVPSYVSKSGGNTTYFDNDKLAGENADAEAAPMEVICYELLE
jgi:hypothetical protein